MELADMIAEAILANEGKKVVINLNKILRKDS